MNELEKQLKAGIELVESTLAHVSHGGPTRAEAENWLAEAKAAFAPPRKELREFRARNGCCEFCGMPVLGK